jgi:predicted DNA-binding protein
VAQIAFSCLRVTPLCVQENGAYYGVIMRTISVKLPDHLLAQLGREAKAKRVTKSCLVRESLEKGLREQPPAGAVSCYDLARDLAGTVKGLPRDFGDNSKYREGFGE